MLASSQHPIALSAMLVMLAPLGAYLVRSSHQRRWWLATGVLVLGALSTLSRTGMMMLAVIVLVFVWQRPQAMRPPGASGAPRSDCHPLRIAGHIGIVQGSLLPAWWAGCRAVFREARKQPRCIARARPAHSRRSSCPGQGYGTRLRGELDPNSFIVDDQWLGTAMETGTAGVLAWVWLFVRAIPADGSRSKAGRRRSGLVVDGDHGIRGGVRRRDVHLRRLLVHPGDSGALPPARSGIGGNRQRAAARGAGPNRLVTRARSHPSRRAGGRSPAPTERTPRRHCVHPHANPRRILDAHPLRPSCHSEAQSVGGRGLPSRDRRAVAGM